MSIRRRLNLTALVCVVLVLLRLSSAADDDHSVELEGYEEVLTADDIWVIVDKHNALRSSEKASNMNYLIWDKELAAMALKWARSCSFEHGSHASDHEDDNVTTFYGNIGHIVHASMKAHDLAGSIGEWYDQKQHYHYDSNSCDPRYSCGKYTQVVWATTQSVGCGLTFCKTLSDHSGQQMKNAYSFICNYAPSGNIANKKPFAKGNPCSHCTTGVLTCFNGLCRENCEKDEVICTCEAQCDNCGKLDLSTCRCICTEGWMGPECNEPCRDRHVSCGSTPGWPTYICKYVDHHVWDFIFRECPAMCETCTISTSLPKCEVNPCDPRNCHNGAIFDKDQCRCMCPTDYTGEYCRLLQSEHLVGATIGIVGPIHKWRAIWKNLLSPLTTSINAFCSNVINYVTCCNTPGTPILTEYVTEANVIYGTDYPVLDRMDRKIFLLLIYATYWPDNTLCRIPNNMEMVPQEVIINTLKDSKELISQIIRTSCEDCRYLDVWPSHTMRSTMSSAGTDLQRYTCKTLLVFVGLSLTMSHYLL